MDRANMRSFILRKPLLSVLIFLLGLVIAATTSAAGRWASPEIIANDGAFAFTPFLVADRGGVVHAVWSTSTVRPNDELGLDTIMYARRENGQWSVPVDIFATDVPLMRAVRLRIDQNDVLHLLIVGRNSLIYAVSPVSEAGSARGWATDELGELVQTADFALDADGITHVVYALDRRGIYHVSFNNVSGSWSDPNAVWLAPSEDYSSGVVRVEQGPDNILHAAWGMTAAEIRWNPIGVAYAHSVDGGQSWRQTFEVLEEGDNQPGIGFDEDGMVHLVWNNSAGSRLGRGHALSADSGLTWRGIDRIFPGYRGQTWWPSMVQDSSQTLHLITAANSPNEGSSSIHHSTWLGSAWSTPERISGQLLGSEGPSITVVNGNQLEVAWFSYSQYGIWTSSSVTDSPYLAPQKIETASPLVVAEEPVATSVSTEQSPPTATPSINSLPDNNTTLDTGQAMSVALLSGVIPILIVVGLITWRKRSG